MNIVKYSKIFFLISILVLIPGFISLITNGLRLSIDFTGGSIFEYNFNSSIDSETIKTLFERNEITVESVQKTNDTSYIIKTNALNVQKIEEIKKKILEDYPNSQFLSSEVVGPSVGKETLQKAFIAVIVSSLFILIYIAYSFRHIPAPYSSFKFGLSAIIALLHDVFIVVGVFSILGQAKHVEINALFITALLTVMGFSVHDTIVVFDRIRENLHKLKHHSFEDIVNFSLVETLNRSLRTSLTVILTLLAMYLLGGDSIKYFILALLIGIVAGTYSSIFNAAPLLVAWENYSHGKAMDPKRHT